MCSGYIRFDYEEELFNVEGMRKSDPIETKVQEALEEISREKQYQEKCLSMLVNSLQLCQDDTNTSMEGKICHLLHISMLKNIEYLAINMFVEVLHRYFKRRLEELSTIIARDDEDNYNHKKTLENIGMVIHNLINLGFTSMTEDAYASTIFLLLKQYFTINTPHQHTELGYKLNDLGGTMAKVNDLAGDEYKNSVLESIKEWIQNRQTFEIIVDYPDSVPAIDDLKQCLEYTGQHSKLVDLFISSLREYLRGRKDTIKCIVTMLTDGMTGNNKGPGNTGDSLLEELNRDEENQENNGLDDDINTNDKQAWINIQQWEPNPIEADPLKGSRY
ncbi:hypothetical protein Tco_1305786 [Tanacetum coccineum]